MSYYLKAFRRQTSYLQLFGLKLCVCQTDPTATPTSRLKHTHTFDIGKMAVDEMALDKMTEDKIPIDKMTRLNSYRQIFGQINIDV